MPARRATQLRQVRPVVPLRFPSEDPRVTLGLHVLNGLIGPVEEFDVGVTMKKTKTHRM